MNPPTNSPMTQAIADHGKDHLIGEGNEESLKEVRQLRHEIENMQVAGGSVAWPYIKTPAGEGGLPSSLPTTTKVATFFVDGTLEFWTIPVVSTSPFGPFP